MVFQLDAVFIHNIEDKSIQYAACRYLRMVFLDFCSPDDRITRLYIIISCIGRVVNDNLWPTLKAKLLLLLYAPIENMAGKSIQHNLYMATKLSTLVSLYCQMAFRETLAPTVTDTPLSSTLTGCWPVFSVYDSIVAAYFRHSYALCFENEAESLIVEAVAVSDKFIRRSMDHVGTVLDDNLVGMIVQTI